MPQPLGTVERNGLYHTLVPKASLIALLFSCPSWNTVDPEVRANLTERQEDGEFW